MTKNTESPTKLYKVGNLEILGTPQDFPESASEALSVRFSQQIEGRREVARRYRYRNPINPIRNRFDRMKSYCLKHGIDWRIDFEDYKRLWEEAPEVFDKEKGRMVAAKDYTDRKNRLRATRISQDHKWVGIDNLVLKLKDKIFYGPLEK